MRHRYTTQLVRDLHWALKSPVLMDHPRAVAPKWGIRETDRHSGLLRKFDRPGSRLAKSVRNAEVTGLGRYFEVLVRTWLEAVPPATLTAANWQVYAGERTIGEFDLLFERDRLMWHWELAIKFYLGHPAPDGQFRWYGVMPEDRLDRKWAKMRGQQLRLQRHPAAQGALEVLGVEQQLTPRAFIKGYLFVPLAGGFDVEFPLDFNSGAPTGWWSHRSQLPELETELDGDASLQWMLVPEMQWMSPAYPGPEDRLCSFEALTSVIPVERPTMVAGLEESNRGLREVTRGFVVPDRWPYFE